MFIKLFLKQSMFWFSKYFCLDLKVQGVRVKTSQNSELIAPGVDSAMPVTLILYLE